MRSKTVPEGMAAGGFRDSGRPERIPHRILQIPLGNVMTSLFATARIDGHFVRGKNVLPRPLACGIRILAVKGGGEMNGAAPASQILVMQFLDAREMSMERTDEARGQNG